MSSGFGGEGILYHMSGADLDQCPECTSPEIAVLEHCIDIDWGLGGGDVTAPFVATREPIFDSDEPRRWRREVWRRAGVESVRRPSIFVESRRPSLQGGYIWWRIQGYQRDLPEYDFSYACRSCGHSWQGNYRRAWLRTDER